MGRKLVFLFFYRSDAFPAPGDFRQFFSRDTCPSLEGTPPYNGQPGAPGTPRSLFHNSSPCRIGPCRLCSRHILLPHCFLHPPPPMGTCLRLYAARMFFSLGTSAFSFPSKHSCGTDALFSPALSARGTTKDASHSLSSLFPRALCPFAF